MGAPPKQHRRLNAMRVALWAAQQERCPTPQEIASQFGLKLMAAREYRNDYLTARAPQAPGQVRHG